MHKSVSGVEDEAPLAMRRVLGAIASKAATSRAAIARETGLARSTVGEQVDYLLDRHVIEESGEVVPTRGRPARPLVISPHAGLAAAVDVNTHATRVAVATLSGEILARRSIPLPVDHGPDEVLDTIADAIAQMVGTQPGHLSVRQVVVGLPAPVDFQRGCAVRPPIMRGGWDGYPVADTLSRSLHANVLVDNDVNLMALGEASIAPSEVPLLFIKVADGIGAGIVLADGSVHRGSDGAAGDIGHITVARDSGVICRCGKVGCLEAMASHSAVLHDLGVADAPDDDPELPARMLETLVTQGDTLALNRIRTAAVDLGQVVAMLIHTLNPKTLVLGGPLVEVHDQLLSGVRAAVYEQALPLATRKLTITTSELGDDAGVVGGIALASQAAFSPDGLRQLLLPTASAAS